MKLKIKDIIPDVEVFQLINNEPVKIRVKKMFQEKKSILLGMPGAFTSCLLYTSPSPRDS